MRYGYWVLFIWLSSCSPHSLEDYQQEARLIIRALTKELQVIEYPEQLLKSEPEIRKKFNQLVDVMIQAREYQQERGLESPDQGGISPDWNESLKKELRRIYQLERGRECIERASQEALIRLDAYERQLKKRRGAYRPE